MRSLTSSLGSKAVLLVMGALATALASTACTVNNNSSDGCSQDSSVAGCGAAVGYSCTGTTVPSDTDSSLICSDSTAGSDGDSLFCCTSYTAGSSTCQADSTLVCTEGSIGFSCGGTDTPDQSDSSLECSTGTANSNGNTTYCCIQYSSGGGSSSCTQDNTVQGCASGSFGFSCTSTDTPQQTDSSLSCSTGTPGNNGETLYCCTN